MGKTYLAEGTETQRAQRVQVGEQAVGGGAGWATTGVGLLYVGCPMMPAGASGDTGYAGSERQLHYPGTLPCPHPAYTPEPAGALSAALRVSFSVAWQRCLRKRYRGRPASLRRGSAGRSGPLIRG